MNNKGISVISLVMTIVVIIIIASVTVYNGLNMIEQSRIRALRDTMQAVSETCTLIWKEANGDVTKLIGTKLGEDPDIYVITPDDLKLMNLSNIDKTFTVNYRTSQVSYLDEKTGQTIYYPENIDMPDPTSLYNTKIEFNVVKGVNRPQLASGLTPIKYEKDGNDYVVTDVEDPYSEDWYDYSTTEKRWANATDGSGTEWVWIPRYAYKIQKYYEYTNYDTPANAIDIIFLKENTNYTVNNEIVPSDYIVHPAFKFGSIELAGIWVMKENYFFNESTASQIYTELRNYPTDQTTGLDTDQIDTHLMKNSEYGAVTYLTHSKGLRNTDTTTGNDYGIKIYPLSIVAGYINDNSSGVLSANGSTLVNADNKYKDVYDKPETGETTYIANSTKVGDAFVETSSSEGKSWNKYSCEMPTASNPFISRGNTDDWNGFGLYEYGNTNGIFGASGPVYDSNVAGCVLVVTAGDIPVTNPEDPEEPPEETPKLYGIKRDRSTSSSEWERIEDSIGKVANATLDGTTVENDFDNIYPWSDIMSYNYNTSTNQITAYYGDANFKFDGTNGEVLTYIPEFYYKREVINEEGANIEYIYISEIELDGYTKSEAFSVGRYKMSYSDSKGHSYSGTLPKVSVRISNFRSYARSLGSSFGQMDWRYFTLQMLYLVEYADYNSQLKLGKGVVSGGSSLASGGCDSLGMKSGCISNDNYHSMSYRGIEDIYGNVFEFIDGINIRNYRAYICYNPANYIENTFDGINYLPLGYLNYSNVNGYPSTLGYDANNPAIALPTAVGGSSNTYMCDNLASATGDRVLRVGGASLYGSNSGLFCLYSNDLSTLTRTDGGSRLIKY
jgi:hypothetical protein